MKHLKYLSYVLRHKWFVFIECCKVGLYWRGLVHDMSKLLPSEWYSYAEAFYGEFGYNFDSNYIPYVTLGWSQSAVLRDRRGRHTEAMDRMDNAWLLHQHRNPHHWQFWVLREDDGGTKCLPMPLTYVFEMVCDWKGAGRALGKPDTRAWYEANRELMLLHPDTRRKVHWLLGVTL
ncbi:MAG: DUF5662 family protein [Armatimonadota bacterium]